MIRKYRYLLTAAAAVGAAGLLTFAARNDFGLGRNMEIAVNMMRELSLNYVDPVDPDRLMEGAAAGMVSDLDPYTEYIPEEGMQDFELLTTGKYGGIGALIRQKDDYVRIAQPYQGSPADKAGLKIGDKILSIDGKDAKGFTTEQVSSRLKGEPGSKVKVTVEHLDGSTETVTLQRERISIPGVPYTGWVADGIGYIKLGQFARTTFDEMQASLDTLRAQGATKLIFDLRGNSGGYLDQAIMVANEFLHKDQLIVYTEDRQHKQLREYADGTGAAQDMDVVVLIDEGSASSSEILAGALQDNDRGTIVGRRSFGKGLVQRQIPYSDGSALRLTTARYYTPTGRSIQKPYTIGDDESYEEDIWNRYKNNEFFSADSIHFADSLKRVTPGGKVVYGGGGIMPDVFVPADTTDVTKYFVEVAGRNILYRYTIEYADRHREALNRVRTIPELQALLDSDKGLVEDFIRYAARKGVAPDYRDIARSRKLIEAQLRAYIGRNTALEDNGFYANIYPVDNVVVRAIGILNDTQKND